MSEHSVSNHFIHSFCVCYLHGTCSYQLATQNTSNHIPLRTAERDAEAAALLLALPLL